MNLDPRLSLLTWIVRHSASAGVGVGAVQATLPVFINEREC
jgi:hypothetical protein